VASQSYRVDEQGKRVKESCINVTVLVVNIKKLLKRKFRNV
jgi:hypothetical protein